MLNIETYTPRILGKFIKTFEYYHCKDLKNDIFHTLLPLGTVQLLFQFETRIRHKTAFSDGWQDRPNVFIGGPYNQAYGMKLSSNSQIFVVTFYPSMSKYFVPTPISELKNKLINPAEIWGKEYNDIIDQLNSVTSNTQRAAIIESFLLAKYIDKKDSVIDFISGKIIRCSGLGKVNEYATLANLSISRFRQRFTEEVGLSPKSFQRIIKINALSKYYSESPTTSLTNLAYQFEYFDQPHFIKDFKSVTGTSPSTYFRNKRFLQF